MSETRNWRLWGKITVFFVICCCCLSAQAKYSGGTGEPNDPYLIATASDMNQIGAEPNDWSSHFLLVNDINLAKYSGEEFNIIGTGIPFTGVFDGNGHTISNFTYKKTFHLPGPILFRILNHTDQRSNTLTNINNMFSDDFIQDEPIVIPTPNDINWTPIPIPFPPSFGGDGLFASVDGVDAEIKNLTLVDPNIETTGSKIGALVGHLHNGVVSNCGVEGGILRKTIGGTVISPGYSHLGGLVGNISDGNVSGCYVSDCYLINHSWVGSAGGLTASNGAGTISNCYVIDSVVESGTSISGGLATTNSGIILNSYTSGSENNCGLVGTNLGTISNCHASGSTQWAGLVGFNEGTISHCYATGTVAGNNFAGGLVSGNKGEISNCYATTVVDGNDLIGGLVGYNEGTISNCYATGLVTGDVSVGALVGYDDGGSYVSCFWDIDVNPDANGIGNATDPNVIGKTTAEMQMQVTFTDAGWDFNTPVWTIDEGVDYPRLWWEFVPVLHAEPEVTLGTSNRISWEPVPSDVEYYAECAEDADFTSIVYNSGWIVETSCEFASLELGKRYWYSVKARNAAGIESSWSNVESSLQRTLTDAVEMMLEPESLKNENMKNALLNKIYAAMKMIEEGNYTGALSKLRNDILAKTNGCAETGEPDKNDWITTCEQQSEIYPLIIETIEHVKGLMGE